MPIRKSLLPLMLLMVLLAGCGAPEPAGTPPPPTATPLLPMTGSGGGRIAYACYSRDNTGDLYVVNADGTDPRRLTWDSAEDNKPTWSPDGTQVAFYSNRQGRSSIYVLGMPDAPQSAGGSAQGSLSMQQLTTKSNCSDPAWSPDGAQIAFVAGRDSSSEIYVMNLQDALRGVDGTDQLRLTHNSAADSSPAWSPDGMQIAFVSDRDGAPAVYVMNADGSDQQRLMQTGSDGEDSPDWSPDGSRIAFCSTRAGHWAIYVANVDGTDAQCLTASGAASDEYAPTWSPDGTRIAFQSNVDGQWDIYVMNADGTEHQRLTTSTENDYEPTWGVMPGTAVQVPTPEMVLVEPGSFEMGSASGRPDEQPVHTVRITRPFYIAQYQLTFDEYDRFCEDTGRRKAEDRGRVRGTLPVSNVTWYDAVAYCNWLSERQGLTPCYSGSGKVMHCDFSANGYRLPTEAEWEYAARGGHLSQGYLYAGSDDPDEVAWYAGSSGDQIQPVGQKKPNELGLYDMCGNMFEWCWDWYGEDYYASSPSDDPLGPPMPASTSVRGPERVRRGGSWREDAINIRITSRSFDYASYVGDNGFRLARTE
jgi:formylglycine-generating enzyme required for sulfatase activity